MDLRDFIKETISAIVTATVELQSELESTGVIINPPVSVTARELYEEGSTSHTSRRIEIVDFDVAISAAAETSGGGKAVLRILSIEAGADGKHQRTSEEVSRVRFSIPLTLAPSKAETTNLAASEEKGRKVRGSFTPHPVV
ncbi:MAG: hypothetical protein INF92_16535 [Rhodobacter sp.]|nr:hypothetical protein [Rhodobacter sp.]